MARKRKSLKFLNILFIILGVILIAWGVNFFLGDRNQAEGEEEIGEPSNIVEEIPEDQEDQEDQEQQEQTEKEIKSVKISAAGDIMFHMSQINGGYDENTDTYNFKPFFEEIKPFIEEADISIANFEGTTAGLENGNVYKAWPVFNVPDETLDAVKYAGFDILSTVNNHSIDMGKDGIIRTIEQIEKRNMMKVGTRISPDEERVLIIEENDIKIAVIAYTYGCNGLEQYLTPEELDYMVNIIDEEKINEDIIYSKENDSFYALGWGIPKRSFTSTKRFS